MRVWMCFIIRKYVSVIVRVFVSIFVCACVILYVGVYACVFVRPRARVCRFAAWLLMCAEEKQTEWESEFRSQVSMPTALI